MPAQDSVSTADASVLRGPGLKAVLLTQAQEEMIYQLLSLAKVDTASLSSKKVLDLGCGVGGSSFALRNMGAKQVVGVTLSEEQVCVHLWKDLYASEHTASSTPAYMDWNCLTRLHAMFLGCKGE